MKRILVCEDEDVIRDFVVINLKRAGYDVVDVNCGEAALKTFEQEHGNFDIVLLDSISVLIFQILDIIVIAFARYYCCIYSNKA